MKVLKTKSQIIVMDDFALANWNGFRTIEMFFDRYLNEEKERPLAIVTLTCFMKDAKHNLGQIAEFVRPDNKETYLEIKTAI